MNQIHYLLFWSISINFTFIIILKGIKCSHVFDTLFGRGYGLYYSLLHKILYSQTQTVRRSQLCDVTLSWSRKGKKIKNWGIHNLSQSLHLFFLLYPSFCICFYFIAIFIIIFLFVLDARSVTVSYGTETVLQRHNFYQISCTVSIHRFTHTHTHTHTHIYIYICVYIYIYI